MVLRITTWNVNGIRNPFAYQPWRDRRTFEAMFELLEADIVILQETKIQRKDLRDDMVLVPGWDSYFSLPKHEKGKFGVAIYTRQSACAPIKAEEGLTGILCPPNSTTRFRDLPEDQQIGGYPTELQAAQAPQAQDIATDFTLLDSEGRCVILEFPAFVLIGLYNPATRSEARQAFRYSFLNLLDIRIRNLVAMGKRVIVTGDLNVSKSEVDTANCLAELRKQGTSIEEYLSAPARRWFNHLLDDGTVYGERDEGREQPVLHDICRGFHPDREGMFTHWETKINARPGNYGSRIDYILCSLDMKNWFFGSDIQEGLMGSDHCPVYAVLKDTITIDGSSRDIHDVMNPPGMFQNGARLREHSAKDILPMSARLIPEFSGRRSIKDMLAPRANRDAVSQPLGGHEKGSGMSPSAGVRDFDSEASTRSQPKLSMSAGRGSATDDSPLKEKQLSSQELNGTKRPRAEVSGASANKSLKRSKSNVSSSAQSPMKGQQSLKGFFTLKSTPSMAERPAETAASGAIRTREPNIEDGTGTNAAALMKQPKTDAGDTGAQIACENGAASQSRPLQGEELGAFPDHDPIENKESWTKVFSKRTVPRCDGHREPCKSMTTKKPGVNCGRSFWMCARPLGPTGEKEKNTRWRCGTFIWCSDWTSGS